MKKPYKLDVIKCLGEWCVHVQIDHQGFSLYPVETKAEATWSKRQFKIALDRMLENNK